MGPGDHGFGQHALIAALAAEVQPVFPHAAHEKRPRPVSYQQRVPSLHARSEQLHVAVAGLH